jgi:hypothetical protein
LSHIVTVDTQVRDPACVELACRRLQLPAPVAGTHELFSEPATGLAVQLPNWVYPVVCDVGSGKVRYDNFEGRWGDRRQLDSFVQAYAVEKARLEARKRGHTITEQPLADGSIKLVIQVAGGAA